MRPDFAEHKVLRAVDLEDEHDYLEAARARHLDRVHGAAGTDLVAASVVHPDEQVELRLGAGPGQEALTVGVAGTDGQMLERLRATAPGAQAPSELVFAAAAPAPAAGPDPGTLCLLAGVGKPPASELRIEGSAGSGGGSVVVFPKVGAAATPPLSIDAAGTVAVVDLQVKGAVALGPALAPPAGAGSPDASGPVAEAEALRAQLAQGLGIGRDTGIGIALANPTTAGGHVRFTVEVTDVAGVAPISVSIKGRVNVGTAVVAEDLGIAAAMLQPGQVLRRAVDIVVPAAAKGDVIAAVGAFGVHPQAGLVTASEARLLGTIV